MTSGLATFIIYTILYIILQTKPAENGRQTTNPRSGLFCTRRCNILTRSTSLALYFLILLILFGILDDLLERERRKADAIGLVQLQEETLQFKH
jgi:preprotein translocase subunit SecG